MPDNLINDNPHANNEDPFSVEEMEQLFRGFEQHVLELLEIQQALSLESADKVELLERFHRLSKEGEQLIERFEKATDIAPSKGVDSGTVSLARVFIRQMRTRLAATNELNSTLKPKQQ